MIEKDCDVVVFVYHVYGCLHNQRLADLTTQAHRHKEQKKYQSFVGYKILASEKMERHEGTYFAKYSVIPTTFA